MSAHAEARAAYDTGPEAPATLVSIGVSTGGALGAGDGPPVHSSEPTAFAAVKPSHGSVRAFLERVRTHGAALEALVWNTCQRTELYAWIADACSRNEREEFVAQARAALFGAEPTGLEVNVLLGDEARHHVLRTACGINSDLPGDRDVAAQLRTAYGSARSAGTAGPRAVHLVAEATALAREVREQTRWGAFATGYCAAALARVREVDGLEPRRFTHVVIGGSTTSRSILETLRNDHGVRPERLTVVHRRHHGQRRELREAVGGGTALQVRDYRDERVLARIARADVVYFGIDRPDPVLEASTLGGLRDFAARPLTLLDFNPCGSLGPGALPSGVTPWSAKALDRAVAAHTAIITARADFLEAVAEAEERIAVRLSAMATPEEPC